jgi:hypothetical protein
MKRKENARLAFMPTFKSREYFDGLRKRLTAEQGTGVRTTQREAFERMVKYAQEGEAYLRRERLLGQPDKVA